MKAWLPPIDPGCCISMLGKGEIILSPMITQAVPFVKAAEAAASSQTNTAEKIKVMVDVSRWE